MTHTIAMKIGASARGKNDIDLFRRPAGLADGLALKEPALHDLHCRGSPQLIGSPVPQIPPGGSAWPGTVLGAAAFATPRRGITPFRGGFTESAGSPARRASVGTDAPRSRR